MVLGRNALSICPRFRQVTLRMANVVPEGQPAGRSTLIRPPSRKCRVDDQRVQHFISTKIDLDSFHITGKAC